MFTGSDRKSGEPPALSVVICTRNRPEKLTRAVASVLANSFADFELIVVDQSTDRRSADAMMSFDDDRIRYYPTATVPFILPAPTPSLSSMTTVYATGSGLPRYGLNLPRSRARWAFTAASSRMARQATRTS
jgi:glycosyltransferase involved in cell wall biosynthesis